MRVEPSLHAALVAAARAQRISASELIRRQLRQSLVSDTDLRAALNAASLAAVHLVSTGKAQARHV